MRNPVARMMLAGVLAASMLGATAPASASDAVATAPYCGIVWGSTPKTGGDLRTPNLVRVTTAKDTCWDRVTFEFNGPVNGYDVRYSSTVLTEGQGLNFAPFTAGGAYLSVSLRAPSVPPVFTLNSGAHTTSAPGILTSRTLRDVVFGGSFEGYSTFAVGVRARLPFRVLVLSGPGTHSRIVIDTAHLW